MLHKRWLISLALIIILLSCSERETNACSCVCPPTVLEQFDWANIVVVVQVVSIEKIGVGPVERVRSVRTIVEKAFKGDLRYKHCPQLEELIRQGGRTGATVQTRSVEVVAEDNITGVELRYAFPDCKKAK